MSGVRISIGVRCALAGLLAIALAGPVVAAMTAGVVAAFVLPPALPPGGNYAPLGQMHIQGQPVSAWVFDAPGTVPDVMSWLTTRQPALRDLWVTPGSAVLGGFADGTHWAARLFDAGQGRTRGTISALPVARDASTADVAWRLKGGRLRFEVRSRDRDAVIVEQIWTHGAPPADLAQTLPRDLAAEGWQLSGTAGPHPMRGSGQWSRGHMRLSMVIVPLDRGSGVTIVMRIGE